MNTIWRSAFVCLLVLLAGCGREAKGPPQPPVPSALPTSPRGTAWMTGAPPPAAFIPDTGDVNATVQKLTLALRDYVVRTRTVPKNFDDFAAKSQASFPQPPDGKKYAIQGQKVILVIR